MGSGSIERLLGAASLDHAGRMLRRPGASTAHQAIFGDAGHWPATCILEWATAAVQLVWTGIVPSNRNNQLENIDQATRRPIPVITLPATFIVFLYGRDVGSDPILPADRAPRPALLGHGGKSDLSHSLGTYSPRYCMSAHCVQCNPSSQLSCASQPPNRPP